MNEEEVSEHPLWESDPEEWMRRIEARIDAIEKALREYHAREERKRLEAQP